MKTRWGWFIPKQLNSITIQIGEVGEGSDASLLKGHFIPGVLTSVQDILVAVQDKVREEVVFQILPWFFSGVEFGGSRRDFDQRDVFRDAQIAADMPSGTVDQHGGMHMGRQLRSNFIEMHLHHAGVDGGQNQANGGIACGAECAEDVGVLVTRIDGRTQANSLAPPATRTRSFLAYSAFILTPDLNRFVGMLRLDFFDDFGEFFLNASIASALCFGWVGRAVM